MGTTAWGSEFDAKRKAWAKIERLEMLLKEVADSAKPVIANDKNTSSVRNKTELGGYVKHYVVPTDVINKINNLSK